MIGKTYCGELQLVCVGCRRQVTIQSSEWKCRDCGEAFLLRGVPAFERRRVGSVVQSMWRYHPEIPSEARVTLGEGCTPLVKADTSTSGIHYKLEYLNPTGSFKDRGMAFLSTFLREMAIDRVVEDSSGNAAASLAAYGARAELRVHVFVPGGTSKGKLTQVVSHGAQVTEVPGTRADAAAAAETAAKAGAYYASHYWNPFVIEGLKTYVYEMIEELDWESPDNIVLPCGHGTLLLGVYYGLRVLMQTGVITRMPRLFCIQADACAPIVEAFDARARDTSPVEPAPSIAEGIRIPSPARGKEVLSALYATQGQAISVPEERIPLAQAKLAHAGFYVEMTSAVAVAGLEQLLDNGVITRKDVTVVGLTGSGLKTNAAG